MQEPVREEELQPLRAPLAGLQPAREHWVYSGMLLAYLAVGTVFFAAGRDWNVLDSLYFSVSTLTTVGYGDFTPHTEAQKLFTTAYVLVGSCLVGVGLGRVAKAVQQREEQLFSERLRSARNGDRVDSHQMAMLRRVVRASHGMMLFLAFGTLFFTLGEGWSTVDSLYFSAVSLCTVGYGDLHLQSSSMKVFAIFYLLAGTLMTVFFLGTIAEILVNRRERLIGLL